MKKLALFIISLVVLMNCMSIAAFAAGNDNESIPSMNARLAISSVAGAATDINANVRAGSTFNISFQIVDADSYENGSAVVTVAGSGFTVDGSGASRLYSVSSGNTIFNLPVYCESTLDSGRYPLEVIVVYSAGGKTVTLTQNLNINVTGNSTTPLPEPDINSDVTLRVTSAPNSAIYAGDTFNISFESYVTAAFGYGYYQSGTVTVSGSGFSLAGALAEQDIQAGRNTVSVLADPNLEAGRHQLTLTVTYKVNGETYTASKALNIDIQGGLEEIDEPVENASFKLTGASISEGKGRANLSTNLKLKFENTSDFTAKNVKIRLTNLGDIILNTYTDTADAGDVLGGQSVNATFPIKFPETVVNPQTTLTAEVSYDSPEGTKSATFNIYLQATVTKQEQQTPESATLTPKVIVSQYGVDVDSVRSGEVFTLTFVLENTSTEKDLRNMTVNVTPLSSSSSGTSSGPVFSFIDGTSSFYTPLLEKSGTLEYSIPLKVSASAGAGSYPINISFNYEYANNGGYSSGSGDMDINLPVVQPVKFEMMEWYPPTECPIDGTSISFQYFNKSRNPMSSLAVTVEGDFEMPTQYVGTLAATSMDYFSGMITPVAGAQVGDVLTGIVVFTFEDASGEEQRYESEPFEVTVTEGFGGMMGDDWGGMMGDDWGGMDFVDPGFPGDFGVPVDGEGVDGEGGGLPLAAKIGIPVGVGAVVIVAAAVIVKKVKAKKDEDDDED